MAPKKAAKPAGKAAPTAPPAGGKAAPTAPPAGGKADPTAPPAGEKKPFLETRRGEITVRVLAVVFFILALVMFILYLVLARRDALITESLRIMREFAVEYDPRYEERNDFEVIALAQNLSFELSTLAEENEEIQAEIDKLAKTLHQWIAFNKNLYYFSKDVKSWKEAIGVCIQKEAKLVSVKWGEEQGFIDEEARRLQNDFWIGLKKNKSVLNGVLWLEGFPAQTVYWNHNQPARRGECIYVSKTCSIKHCWNDGNCAVRKRFICKKEPIKSWYYALR